jgi:hypothetical protein
MDTEQIDTDQLVEWIELEGLCCPFFGFEILLPPAESSRTAPFDRA